jgi:hypothetical protein
LVEIAHQLCSSSTVERFYKLYQFFKKFQVKRHDLACFPFLRIGQMNSEIGQKNYLIKGGNANEVNDKVYQGMSNRSGRCVIGKGV